MAELNSTSFITDANLLAYYRLETGALTTDSKGSNTLTNNNTVGEGTGRYGVCADYGSSNTTKSLSRAARLSTARSNFTMGAWIKTTNLSQSGIVMANGGQLGGIAMVVCGTNGAAGGHFQILDEAIGWYDTAYDVVSGLWQLLVVWNDGEHTKGYVNNREVYSVDMAQTGVIADTFGLGCGLLSNGTPELQFSGLIDDAFYFNRALSTTELKQLYEATPVSGDFYSTSLITDANLLHYYRFEGDSHDSIGTYDGTDTNITYASGNGKFGMGIASTAGSGDGISVGNGSNLNFTSGDFSFSFWFNPQTNANNKNLFCRGLYTDDGYLCAVFASGDNVNMGFYTYQNAAVQAHVTSTVFELNNWHHVAITRSGTAVKIYKNGQECLYGTAESHTDPETSTRNFYIARYDEVSYESAAKIDDFAIFNRLLTPTEVNDIYAGTIATTNYLKQYRRTRVPGSITGI
jgi:hypothetical protein